MPILSKLAAPRLSPSIVISLGALIAIGAFLGRYPIFGLALFGTVALFVVAAFVFRKLAQVEVWQLLSLLALMGYVVLNYGFANLAFHLGGIPIIIGHSMMLGALVIVAFRHRPLFVKSLRDPAVLCILILIVLAVFRLCFDVAQFGLYAIRDASMFTEGIFLVLGFMWAMARRTSDILVKWLMIVFALNFVYVCSFPFSEELMAWSPKTGIFLEVPLLGVYAGNDPYLLAGSLFCLLVGKQAVNWSRRALVSFAVVQLLGLSVLQARSEYLSLVVCLCILALFGQVRKCGELICALSLAMTVLLLLTSVFGLELTGRVGPVNLTFLREHASSLLGQRDAPAAGTIDDRRDWYGEVWGRLRSDSTALLFGEGFGKPLIDWYSAPGVATRQPHNSHLSVLARMGIVGAVVWLAFHYSILRRFAHAFRARAHVEPKLFALVMWLFLLYVILTIEMSVQPGLEFSNGAIPFYFFMGFALGLIRFRLGAHRLETRVSRTSIALPIAQSSL